MRLAGLYIALAFTSRRHQSLSSFSAANMSAPIPRYLLPRGHIFPYTQLARSIKQRQVAREPLSICRNASASASKPLVLEKPTKFNPPSHGKRLKQQNPRRFGPQLTSEQKVEQKTKKYPHMMPPPGTFMYWFLTNRGIHTFISLASIYLNKYLYYQQTKSSLSIIHNTDITPPGYTRPPRLLHRIRKLAPSHQLPRTSPRS